MEVITLYTRAGCCLCDVMKHELERRGFLVKEVDVDSDATLAAKYGWDVPVAVRADGTLLAKHVLASH